MENILGMPAKELVTLLVIGTVLVIAIALTGRILTERKA